MPRAVPVDTARRRRDRLSELIDALGAARGQRVTQREFAASIGREQGTVAAILGGDRSLGADVMMAVVQTYRLPSDYFDRALRPDPRPFARAAVGQPGAAGPAMGASAQAMGGSAAAMPGTGQAMGSTPSAITGGGQAIPGIASSMGAVPTSDVGLAEAVAALSPDRSVAMALEALSRRGLRADGLGWERLVIGAQSAHDHGVLLDWFDATLAACAAPTSATADDGADEVATGASRVRGRK
jgi:hypothetical protein